MSTVFLAEDLKHGRRVAIKILRPELTQAIGRERFVREIELIARLTHPHIIPLHDSGAVESGMFYVMPHIEGESLRTRLEREHRLPLDDAVRLTREIASALGYAHRQGIVHRDIKPENILLAEGIALISDFGIARPMRPANVSDTALPTAITAVGTLVGTPLYMAPEQFTSSDVDARTDLYALACVLFEMLTGEPPFPGPVQSLAYQHLVTPPRRVSQLRPDLPEALGAVLTRALAKAPRDRYPSAARFAEAVVTAGTRSMASGALEPRARNLPHSLPKPRTRFIGRERELAACAALLGETRILSVTGVGGTGKTRLALQLAESEIGRFPGGAWFVDLAPVSDPVRVLEAVATALEVKESAGRRLLDGIFSRIRGARALLVLDNCEHVLAVCAEVADTLLRRDDTVGILATSREPLGIEGERVFALRPLDVPDATHASVDIEASEAVQLFLDRARLAQPDFHITAANRDAVLEICRRLDGIPLALELAASKAKVLSMEQIRARLDDRFRLLTGSSRSALPRQQTLLATLHWSHDQLSPDEQSAFRALSVFAGGWALEEAAHEVGQNRDEFEVIDRLAQLVNKSLVLVDREGETPRYRMLETVREYAQDRLEEAGETAAARARHAEAYLELAERAFAERTVREQPWSDRLDTERENLAAALAHFREFDAERYLQLAGGLAWFWHARSHFKEGSAHVTAALERSAPTPVRPARARAMWGAALMLVWQGDVTAARQWMEDSLRMLRELGDRREIASALEGIGWTLFASGDDPAAYATFEECLRLQTELGDPYQITRARVGLAQMSVALDRVEQAEPLARDIISFAQPRGERRQEHFGWHFLADCALIRGRFLESLKLYRRSLELARAIGDRLETGFELQGVAMSVAGLGENERAARLAGAVEAEMARIGAAIQVRFWNALLERFIGGAKRALGSEAERVTQEGRALSFDDAIALALGTADALPRTGAPS